MDIKLWELAWLCYRSYSIESEMRHGFQQIETFDHDDVQAVAYTRDNFLVIAIRGTDSFTDCLSNLKGSKEWTSAGRVHSGFLRYTRRLYGWCTFLAQKMQSMDLILTGHSLGGAIASILGTHLKMDSMTRDIHVTTFGSPMAGTRKFAKRCGYWTHHVRVSHSADKVPRLVTQFILGYAHVNCPHYFINGKGEIVLNPSMLVRYRDIASEIVKCLIATIDPKTEATRLTEYHSIKKAYLQLKKAEI